MTSTILKTRINYPLIWHEGEFPVQLGSQEFQFRFERDWVDEGDHALGGFATADGVEIPGDRHGRVAYTEVAITLDGELPEGDLEMMVQAREIAKAVINRVLKVYRVDTGEAYIEPISKVDLGRIRVREVDDDGQPASDFQTIDAFPGGLQRARYADPTQDALAALEHGESTPFSWVLLLDAQRELIFDKPRESVIHAQTAVEVAVQQAVKAYYDREEEDGDAIQDKLDAGLKNLMKDHLPKATDAQFWGTDLQERWTDSAYSVRNKAVHEGASVSPEVAENAFSACRDVIAWIGQKTMWLEDQDSL